jgi:outer membrane protein assembly factor BamE
MNTVRNRWRSRAHSGVICITLLVAGCSASSSLPGFKAYRIDIQQGNAVTQEMVAKLKPGMTRAQVRFALGTPLIVDPFRSDRWDYVYYYDKPGAPRESRHVVVIFKGDRLERLEGDVVPSGVDGKGTLGIDKPAAASGAASPAAKTGSGAAAQSEQEASTAAGQSSTSDKPGNPAPAGERGFFGRMLDSPGF